MPTKKRINYSAMFSYNEKRGLYYCKRDGKQYSAKDPEKLYEKIAALDTQTTPPPSFRSVAEAWHDVKWTQITDNTKNCYTAYYNMLVEDLGDIQIDEITAADVQRVILRMKGQGYSAKTVKTAKTVANMIMNYALTQIPPLIRFNPVSAVSIPRGLPRTKRKAPEEDIRSIIDANVRTAYFGLYPYFLTYTGCRRGEALAVTWDDIDFQAKIIRIDKSYTFPNGMPQLKEPKTEAGIRTIPLFPQLEKELLFVKPEVPKPGTIIFGMPGNKPMSENAFRRHWTHWAQDVGLASDSPTQTKGKNGRMYDKHNWKATVTPHQLRHLFVTLCYEAGIDAETTKTWAGHSDISVTLSIYTDLRKSHELEQKQKMEAYLSGLTSRVD